jgi:hypothetical protein
VSTPFGLAPFIARHAASVARASPSAVRTAVSPVAFAALSIARTAPARCRSAGSFLTLALAARVLTSSILRWRSAMSCSGVRRVRVVVPLGLSVFLGIIGVGRAWSTTSPPSPGFRGRTQPESGCVFTVVFVCDLPELLPNHGR